MRTVLIATAVVAAGLFSQINHAQPVRDVTGINDVSGFGEADLATFAEAHDQGINVTIYAGRDGSEVGTITFLDSRYRPVALERVVYMEDTAMAGLAVLATHYQGHPVVEIRDPFSGDFMAAFNVLNRLWEVVDLTVIDDFDGDGVSEDPALAVLARLPGSGKILVQIIRISDGAVIGNYRYLNPQWTPLAIAAAQSAGMPPVLAVLAAHTTKNKLLIESRSVSTGALHGSARPLNRLWHGEDLTTLADLNGDGVLDDPAWLVLGANPANGVNVVQTLRVSDGGIVAHEFILNRLWDATRLATTTDIDRNNQEELLISAFNPNTNNRVIHLHDYASGQTVANLFLEVPINTRLADLKISAGEFDQIFQPGQPDYTATVGFLIPTTTVTATTEDPNAALTVDGVAVDSGVAGGKLTLNPGSNTISIIVSGVDGLTTASYTIDIARQTASSFAQRAYIKASNTDDDDRFGWSAVLDGGTLAVGTINESSAATGVDGDQANNSAEHSGAVYVFTQDGSGTWSQQAYLKATNTEMFDSFGWSLALDGDTLAVGAYWEASGAIGIDGDQSDNSAEGAGAVYVFTRNGAGDWSPQAYIKASNTDPDDHFGRSLALDGDTLAVGATGDDSAATGVDGDQDDDNAEGAGAAYVFTRDSAGVWSQQAYLKASNTDSGDGFGVRLALADNTLAVSAIGEDSSTTGVNGDQADNSADLSGAVYIFTRDESHVWLQQAYVKASNTDATDNFGNSVALDGNTLVVSAFRESSSLTGGQADNSAGTAGAAYVFTRDSSDVWTQQAFLKASNAESGDYFGSSLSLSGDTLVVTATDEASAAMGVGGDQADNTAILAGAGYVFTRDAGGVWTQQVYVKASNSQLEDEFGRIVALDGDIFVISAPLEDSAATGVDGDQSDSGFTIDSGAVYVFQ